MDRYDLADQCLDNGLWDWDLNTNRIHYSPGWISMLGCAGTDFGNSLEEWFKRIHPEDLQSVRREINTQLSEGSAQFEIQHRMIHQDGCYRWMSCRGVISRDGAGRATRITGSHVDITTEKVVDALTGLPNRLLLLDRLTRSIEKARKREDFLFAVLVVDLDLFESGVNRLETVNADSLVIAAARRMETFLRAKDTAIREGRAHLVARSVGEEFIILLDGLGTLSEAKSTAERLLKEILAPFEFNGGEVYLSPSIGIAVSATGYRNADEALRDADTALYRAKSLGKSRCEVFDTAVLETMQTRNQLEKDLHEGLSRNEFLVFYQPIVCLSTNRIAGFEALVRWNHPSRGLVMPLEFIGVAEKTGLIASLGRWVLQEACKQLRTWKKDPRISKDLWVSVNLSSTQFLQPTLAKDIRSVLLEVDFPASGLMLELTEGAVMENPEAARSLLMQLRVMGARIGLDDFGTGYSSLAYLRRFPLDYLKIDHSFVKSIETSPDTREIIRAINNLARQLGLRVIAEGIENSSQLELLRSLQCEYGQGFLFSRAVAGTKAEALLLEGLQFDEGAAESSADPGSQDSPIPASTEESDTKMKFGLNRKHLAPALPALALLIMASLAVWINHSSSPTISRSSPAPAVAADKKELPKAPAATVDDRQVPGPEARKEPAAALAAPKPVRKTAAPDPAGGSALPPASSAVLPKAAQNAGPAPETQKRFPAATVTSAPAAASKSALKAPAAPVYEFQAVHDHVFGSCKGILKFTLDGVSFISEKEKDSFHFTYPEFSYALDGDLLTIKAESGNYRFKSATARNKDENRAQLYRIYQRVSTLYLGRTPK